MEFRAAVSTDVPTPTPTRSGYTFKGFLGKNEFNKNNYLLTSNFTSGSTYTYAKINLSPNTEYVVSVFRRNGFEGKVGYLLLSLSQGINSNWTAISHASNPNTSNTSNKYTTGSDGILYIGYSSITQQNLNTIWENTDVVIQKNTGITGGYYNSKTSSYDSNYIPFVGTGYINSSSIVKAPINHTLYADWTANNYTLTTSAYTGTVASATGGTAYIGTTGTTTSKSVTYDSSVTVKATTKTGYNFVGWFEDSGLTKKLSSDAVYTFNYRYSANKTLYAKFVSKEVPVKINFVGCTNNSSTADGSYRIGTTINLKATIGSNNKFEGWTGTNTNGTISSASTVTASYTITAADVEAGKTLVFTGVARQKRYTVNFYTVPASGGTATLQSTEIYDVGMTYTKTLPTEIGYNFTGWYTSNTLSGTPTTSFTSLSTTDGATVSRYALKTVKNITVSFSVNGEILSSKTYTYGQAYGTLPTIPTNKLAGYTFGGWFKNFECTEEISSTTLVKDASNHTIYAKMTPKTVTIAFSFGTGTSNNGSSASGSTTYKPGDVINLRAKLATGYAFDKWTGTNINGTISGNTMAGATYTVTGADCEAGKVLTFTASAKAITYTVKFWIVDVSDNNKTSLYQTKTFTFGTSQTVAVPSLTGYTTTGWYATNALTGTAVTTFNNLTTQNGAVLNYYAKREVITYTITYILNGSSYKTETVTYGTAKALLSKSEVCKDKNFKESIYSFYGWFTTNPAGQGDLRNLSTISSLDKTNVNNTTVYGRLFKTRATGEEGYSDSKIVINVNLDGKLNTSESYGIVLVEYFDSELGYTRNFSFMLTNGTITLDGLKYADVKITIQTNIKAKVDKEVVMISTSYKSSASVTFNITKVNYNGYVDSGNV